jgi:hypothetical protein
VELATTVQNKIEEEDLKAMESVKQVARPLFAVTPRGHGGTIVEDPEPERELNDQQNNMEGVSASGPYETAGHSLNFKFESPCPDEAVGNKEQTLDKSTDNGAEKQEFPDDHSDSINVKTHISINSKASQNTELLRSHLH